jgi:hypothetical protein
MTVRTHAVHHPQPAPGRATLTRPQGWRAAIGLTAVAAGGAIIAGSLLPWVEAFAGLIQVPGIQGRNGQILAALGAIIIAAGLVELARPGQAARWVAGVTGFAAAGFSGYLLIQLARSMRVLGGDSMVIARGGPGLWLTAAGAVAAFATLFFPASSQVTLRRDTGRPMLAWVADRDSAGLRRGLQIALGLTWLLDAALQYQPYMFTKAFSAGVLMPSAMGQPAFVSGPVLTTARVVASHPVAWNALFATIQLALAAGLFFRATTRAALAGTVAWGLAVWWLGEGLGMMFGGMGNPLTGAPGGALLYAFLAVLLWPRPGPGDPGETALTTVAGASLLGRWARPAWSVLWAGLAAMMLLAPASSSPLTANGGTRATVLTIGLAAVFSFAAAGVWVSAAARPAIAVAVIAALFVWGAGEQFGQLFSGTATDPNTGPLLVLIALAFWASRRAAPRPSSAPE